MAFFFLFAKYGLTSGESKLIICHLEELSCHSWIKCKSVTNQTAPLSFSPIFSNFVTERIQANSHIVPSWLSLTYSSCCICVLHAIPVLYNSSCTKTFIVTIQFVAACNAMFCEFFKSCVDCVGLKRTHARAKVLANSSLMPQQVCIQRNALLLGDLVKLK